MNNEQTVRTVSIPLAAGIFFLPLIFAWFTLRKGYSQKARAISLGWLVFALVCSVANPAKHQPIAPAAEPVAATAPAPVVLAEVDSYKVSREFAENEVAAEVNYKGKDFKVTGTVTDIKTGPFGGIVVVLRAPNMFTGAQMSFDDSTENKQYFATKVSKGMRFTAECRNKGAVIGSVMWDCK